MAGEERLVGGETEGDEATFEQSLRPRLLKEYIGQPRVKDNLAVFLEAARRRAEPLDLSLIHI